MTACPGPPHAGHASSDWTCPLEDRKGEKPKINKDLAIPAPRFEHEGHTYELHDDRIVRDGTEFGVLVSPEFGAGFVTWCIGVSPTEPRLVAAVLTGKRDLIASQNPVALARELGATYMYLGGARNLVIEWLPLGTRFRIDEYDGHESIITASDLFYE